MTGSDLAAALLRATLDYAKKQLEAYVAQTLADAKALADSLGVNSAVALGQKVEGHLQAAKTEFVAFFDAVSSASASPPASAAALETQLHEAIAHLCKGLDELDQTLAAIDEKTAAAVRHTLKDALASVLSGVHPPDIGANPGSVLKMLDLPDLPDGLELDGTKLSFTISRNQETLVAGTSDLLTLGKTDLKASLDFKTQHLAVSVAMKDTKVKVSGLEFLASMLPGGDASIEADLELGLDSVDGFTIGGGLAHKVTLPARPSLPGLDVRELVLAMPDVNELAKMPDILDPSKVAGSILDLGATLRTSLGEMATFSLEGVGPRLTLDPQALLGSSAEKLFESVDLTPPSGIGIAINAGPVKGGGYLAHTGDDYAGALDVTFGPVEVKAVGILSFAGGQFSLIVIVSAEFTPPIELGLAFTLNGLGGIVGIQHVIDTDALRQGLRTHALDNILFPKDPVGSAPAIISTLRSVFPRKAGGVVIGPMAKLGWGRPISFVTASVAVVISMPDPKIVILGSLRMALPAPEAPIVDLKADLEAVMTPQELSVFVSLSDSRIAGFPVSGDLALVIGFAEPGFIVSAGGFHPHYAPPKTLAAMRRITIDLSPPAGLSLVCSAYVALTTNSFQLGARADLAARAGPVSAEGYLEFDAIVRWAPTFSFEIDLAAGVSLRAFGENIAGVTLRLHLGGPAPWTAQGYASVSLFFFDIELPVGPLEWGDRPVEVPAEVAPVALVAAALRVPAAWQTRLPSDAERIFTFRADPGAPHLIVHPLGAFEVRQHVVPLETMIDRIGSHSIAAGQRRVHLEPALIGDPGVPAGAVSFSTDLFAPGQFLSLTDDQALARPAFEPFPAGMCLNSAAITFSKTSVETVAQWETCYPNQEADSPLVFVFPRLREEFKLSPALTQDIVATGAAKRSMFTRPIKATIAADPIRLADAGTSFIRAQDTLGVVAGAPAAAMTATEAHQLVRDLNLAAAQVVAVGVQA